MTRNDLIRCLMQEYGHEREELTKVSDEQLVDMVIADMLKEI